MYKHLLAATDGSDLASSAVKHAAMLARSIAAKLTIVTVTSPIPVFATADVGYAIPSDVLDQIEQANAAQAHAILDEAVTLVQPMEVERVHISGMPPYEGILEAADKVEADLIVMASHGRSGLNRLLLGSQAARILALSKIPVLVVK